VIDKPLTHAKCFGSYSLIYQLHCVLSSLIYDWFI